MGRARVNKVKIEWSNKFAYAIGILATDGNLSSDGRHLNVTSKDLQMIHNFKICLGLQNKIGMKSRGGSKEKKYYVLQFGDKNFYEFLNKIGLQKAKSKSIDRLKIPDVYFADFLRGCIDGDGNIGVNAHPESKHLQLKIRIFSASLPFLIWIQTQVSKLFKPSGGWIRAGSGVSILEYGKEDSIKILKLIYYDESVLCLTRKFEKAKPFIC